MDDPTVDEGDHWLIVEWEGPELVVHEFAELYPYGPDDVELFFWWVKHPESCQPDYTNAGCGPPEPHCGVGWQDEMCGVRDSIEYGGQRFPLVEGAWRIAYWVDGPDYHGEVSTGICILDEPGYFGAKRVRAGAVGESRLPGWQDSPPANQLAGGAAGLGS